MRSNTNRRLIRRRQVYKDTSGIEVFGMMDGRVDLVLDAGTFSGPGATTVDVTEAEWKVIKEGAISEKEIAECLRRQ